MAGADDAILLLTGFGPFEGVPENPSGRAAEALAADPDIHSVVLPVSFRAAPLAFDAALAQLEPTVPAALIGLGVHRGPEFRLERRACRPLRAGRPDLDGVSAAAIPLEGPPELCTGVDLEALAGELRAAGAGHVRISDDAGGYVCERLYRHSLEAGARLGIPAVFLHVPPLAALPLERQLPVVRELVRAIRSRAS
jgi:pyroglutamyl-peptidase